MGEYRLVGTRWVDVDIDNHRRYMQNASVFRKKTGALRKACKDVEFVYVDAPNVLVPADVKVFGEEDKTESDESMATARGWWRTNPERTSSVGLDKSLEVLKELLRGSRFDAVLGFSQGAAMAALLVALLERPDVYPEFLINGEAPHPPLTKCVCVAGFVAPGGLAREVFGSTGYETETVHVLGETDVVVVRERSEALVGVGGNVRVVEHLGGHFVPTKLDWRGILGGDGERVEGRD